MFIVLKPVLWSPNGHTSPAGNRPRGEQWADEVGFAIEEWNGSQILAEPISIDGDELRIFHAEPVEAAAAHPGSTVILMYASHGGQQYLVGAASRATNAVDKNQSRKVRVALKSKMKRMESEAWRTPGVANRFKGNFERFHEKFGPLGDGLFPGWFAPTSHFFWLETPVVIDVQAVTGKTKLLTEYRGSTHPTSDIAAKILRHVPKAMRTAEWTNVHSDLYGESDSVAADVMAIASNKKISETIRKALVNARLGQGAFRKSVLQRWGDSCAVTGATTTEALRASHIRAWSKCDNNKDRLDPNNGILLVATIDSLFDKHLISFDENGVLLVSKSINTAERIRLGLNGALTRALTTKAAAFMRHHRRAFSERESGI